MIDADQIKACQTPKLPYLAAGIDAENRLAKGEQQSFCATCDRWKWLDERCSLYQQRSIQDGSLENPIRIYPDGDSWCALLGADLQEGVAGFGDSPLEAIAQLMIVLGAEFPEVYLCYPDA